jgi:type II secretory pathway component PulL
MKREFKSWRETDNRRYLQRMLIGGAIAFVVLVVILLVQLWSYEWNLRCLVSICDYDKE